MNIYRCKKFVESILKKIGLIKIGTALNHQKLLLRNYNLKLASKKRKKGVRDKKYEKIKEFEGIYKGKRCFIVCTGPSLTVDDLNKLKNDITFSMNSIFKIFSSTSWRPDYYFFTDSTVYEKLQDSIDLSQYKYAFFNCNLCKNFGVTSKNLVQLPVYSNYIWYKEEFKIDFSDNLYAIVYEGYTVTYLALQMAAYMGFKEIYLLGCDCNYSGEKQHLVEYGIKVKAQEAVKTENNLIVAFSAAKEYADKHGIKIYNATRGGKLEVFERVDFDSLFPEDEKE